MVDTCESFPVPRRRVSRCLWRLLVELCSELELNYDTDDFFAFGQTIAVIEEAKDVLETAGEQVPPVVDETLNKFYRTRN